MQRDRSDIHVLIVEDETSACEASRRYLDFMGFRVATAASAREAEARAADTPPDVVVCDWRLDGDRDGIDVARMLEKAHGTKVIFVTAFHIDDLKDRTRDLDVACYLNKPVSLTILADTIAALMEGGPPDA